MRVSLLALPLLLLLRLNMSPSVPCGVYLCLPLPAQLTPGMYVTFSAPEPYASLLPSRLPLVKRLRSVPGMTWTPAYGGLLEEGENGVQPILVREGQVIVEGDHPRSLDSRYMGPIPRQALRWRLIPLFTW